MADSVKHFLYLLPDVAYAVELIPDKDGKAYVIRDYLQVNGEFMDDNAILPASMEKLVAKLQPQPYELILPDFLFTNTVVNVDATGDEAVRHYINETLIPSLELSKDTHSIQSFILTEHKGTSKVQLSALEQSVLDPVRAAFVAGGPTIKQVAPLSWTLKTLISLEPSISVVQLGANLYLAQHYIGVDQTNYSSVEDTDKLVETIKTLKGAEPSIQTLYLLSSALVENSLKEGLKETLPIQQLADDSEESEMPSYVKQVVEASAKTLSIADYHAPVFIMEETAQTESVAPVKEVMPENKKTETETVLPEPTQVGEDLEETPIKEVVDEKPAEEKAAKATEEAAGDNSEPELQFATAPAPVTSSVAEVEPEPVKPEEVDLKQFSTQEAEQAEPAVVAEPKKPASPAPAAEPAKPVVNESPAPKKNVIKNDTGVNNMVRMIFIGLVSFFVTVGIGLGIGLGLLTFTKPDSQTTEPTPVVTPTAEPTPTPTPTPEISRADYDVLVVNATTRAGYAGDIADKLEEAGFENVTAQNAKGDYDEGDYLLMEEEDQSLVSLVSEDSGLSLEYAEGKAVEDTAGNYDFVLVLAQ